MAARRASICRRYPFQQIENQHLIGHSIERRCLRIIFKSCIAIGHFPRLPAVVPMLNTLAD